MDESLIKFAMDAIEGYLQKYPDSADTVEGIHQWWIRWPNFPESISITLTALEHLEQAGTVERRKIGKRKIWRRPTSPEAFS